MTEETTAPEAAAADKPRGVGTIAREALAERKTNEEALEAVKAELPDAKTSLSSINWYRNKMRSEGLDVPKANELKKERKAAEDAAAGDAGDDGI